MVKLARWGVFVFSTFFLVMLMRFYILHPSEILEFDLDGLRRLAAFVVAGYGCVWLGNVLFNPRRNTSNVPSSGGINASPEVLRMIDSLPKGEHLFKTAFRRSPILFSVFLLFLISLPFLFASFEVNKSLGATYWSFILIGELLIAATIIIAWYRVKHLVRKHQQDKNLHESSHP